jgi:hypothetical protein
MRARIIWLYLSVCGSVPASASASTSGSAAAPELLPLGPGWLPEKLGAADGVNLTAAAP